MKPSEASVGPVIFHCPGPPEGTGKDGENPGPCPSNAPVVWGIDERNGLRILRCQSGCGFYRYEN